MHNREIMKKIIRNTAIAALAITAFMTAASTASRGEETEPSVTTLADRYGIPLPKRVNYNLPANAGDIIINSGTQRLYYLFGDGTALEYIIAVGKQGHNSPVGMDFVSRKRVNPSWTPTPSMVARNPRLHTIAGGHPKNPLGPRALYIGSTAYRIHGTIDPLSIGKAASMGCFRMYNDDVIDLFDRVREGARVIMIRKPTTPGISAYVAAARINL